MARGHVPRFGDWNQDAAYTTCFDTARKEKASGICIFNPYDPEQAEELCKPGGELQKPRGEVRKPRGEPHKPGGLAAEPQYPKEGRHRDKHREYDGRKYESRATDVREERKHKGRYHGNHRSLGEAGFFPSQSPVKQGRTSNTLHATPSRQRTTAVPKFGEWNAADPKSAAGYTVIFNQVKEDKKAAAASPIPAFTPQRAFSLPRSYSEKEHSFFSRVNDFMPTSERQKLIERSPSVRN
ncbi:hypothetical protein ZIOFF_070595 [Zingiber officinale]|uniref:RIN4 pathogenic type III effector avirulence factor Avr cleavage site domain-containing protein n=1 Tax=Zingiber officinale TaxID=94328 RepID=A0A8J5EN49_ZINOF|nr:hypothetical protein ZIOFF_070595 [Zingiber officinale]